MNTVDLHWHANNTFIGTDEKGHSVLIESEKLIGFSPIELLLHSLAACTATDIVGILRKQRAELQRLSIRASGTRRDEYPRKFTAIHMDVHIEAANLTHAQAERAVSLSLEKYCSVGATLDPTIPVTTSIVLNPQVEAVP